MNSLANGKILSSTKFKTYSPAAYDAGGAIDSTALLNIKWKKINNTNKENLYLGLILKQ